MSEIGLFIVWPRMRKFASTIVEDIGRRFTIKRIIDLEWSEELFFQNCYRFYSDRLSTRSVKEKLGAHAPLRVIIFEDDAPYYEIRTTGRGIANVNINLFDLKKEYRKLCGTKFGLHGSNNLEEVNRDLTLLLGTNLNDFLKQNEGPWDGKITYKKQDIIGARGWSSLKELFYVLNAVEPYVVLRNFEQLPEEQDENDDIDFLCVDPVRFSYTTNAKKLSKSSTRANHSIIIAGKEVNADFRAIGDGYFDQYWQRDILKRRILNDKGIYIPPPQDAFHSLIYHVLINKTSIADKYVKALPLMANKLGISLETSQHNFPISLRKVLFGYMHQQDYQVVEPKDVTLRFNKEHGGEIKFSRERRLRQASGIKAKLKRLLLKAHRSISLQAK